VDVDHEGLVVFCGTVPLIGGGFRPAPRFGAELVGADGKTLLECTYEVQRREQA
jgi:hypothetical protein